MAPYDPKQRYFGPQGSDLCYLIPPFPPGVPQLAKVFNKSAYTHDVGYDGESCSWWAQWFVRRKIDKQFRRDLLYGIYKLEDEGTITRAQAEVGEQYAELAYEVIRKGGWMYFRKQERLY